MEIEEVAREIEEAGTVLQEESAETGDEEVAEGNEEEDNTGGDDETSVTDGKPGGGKEEQAPEKKEDASQAPAAPTTEEIAKLEAKIELLKERTPNIEEFYKNVDKYLSDEEMALRFDEDQSAYIAAVEQAKEKFLSEKSNDDEVAKLQEQLERMKKESEISSAIAQTLEEFPDYDHQTIGDFFTNDLTRREQEQLQSGVSTYAEFFKAIYRKWRERNPGKVESVKPPNIPDVSKARKSEGAANAEVFENDDRSYLDAVGFRKL